MWEWDLPKESAVVFVRFCWGRSGLEYVDGLIEYDELPVSLVLVDGRHADRLATYSVALTVLLQTSAFLAGRPFLSCPRNHYLQEEYRGRLLVLFANGVVRADGGRVRGGDGRRGGGGGAPDLRLRRRHMLLLTTRST